MFEEENWEGVKQKSPDTQQAPGFISDLPVVTLSCMRSLHLASKLHQILD